MGFYRCVLQQNNGGGTYDPENVIVTSTGSGDTEWQPSFKKYFEYNSSISSFTSVVIKNNVTDCSNLFNSSSSFNANITIGTSVTSAAYMLSSCRAFNSTITFLTMPFNCYSMFNSCANFNRPMPNIEAKNISRMFNNCANFNQPINIFNVSDMSSLFNKCAKFNQPVYIVHNSSNMPRMTDMFTNATAFGSRVYFDNLVPITNLGNTIPAYNSNIFRNCNNSLHKVLYCRNLDLFNLTDTNSIVGAPITWTTDTDGSIYNTAYNIRCSTNFDKIYT